MRNLSVRGVDDEALAELKRQAAAEGTSLNALVVKLLDPKRGRRAGGPALRRHDDLDALAGAWRKDDGARFERATAPFNEVDPALWK